MSSEEAYFRDLDILRSLFDRMLVGDAELPPYLRPENQQVTEDIRSYASTVREAFLRGDLERISSMSLGLAAAGFDRSSPEEASSDIPELDEARERVKRRLAKDDEDDQGRRGQS